MSKNDPAYPHLGYLGPNNEEILPCSGLTKREAAAIAVMQGLLSNSKSDLMPDRHAKISVEYADALLDELEKGK